MVLPPKEERKKKRKGGKSERTNGRHQFLGDYTAREREAERERARKMKVGGTDGKNIPMLPTHSLRATFSTRLSYMAVSTIPKLHRIDEGMCFPTSS